MTRPPWCGRGSRTERAIVTTDTGWRVTVPPGAVMALHKKYGSPNLLLAGVGFWATLHAAPGRLWLVRGNDTIEIPDVERINTGPVDTGRGIWMQGVVITRDGEQLPLLPFERHGLLPHTIQDPSAIAAAIRAAVFSS